MSLHARAESIEAGEVPVIDIAPLRDGTDPAGVGAALARAAAEVGFLYVRNHGVDAALVERARRVALEFFRLPDEAKREAGTNRFHHGYLKPGSTKMYDDAKLDLKESFNWGIEFDGELDDDGNPDAHDASASDAGTNAGYGAEYGAGAETGSGAGTEDGTAVGTGIRTEDGTAAGTGTRAEDGTAVGTGIRAEDRTAAGTGTRAEDGTAAGTGTGANAGAEPEPANPLIGPNVWPAALPELRASVYPYFEAASACAEDLLRGFALGAGLDPEHFIRHRDRPVSRGSLQYYPPPPDSAAEDQFGVAPHTDFGVLTVLCQDEAGGLEIQRHDGGWIAMPPIPGTFVVNIGDLLHRWSNRRYRSTVHRVINSSGRERLSLVLAYDPNFETLVDARAFCATDESPHDAPITCGDYLLWRFGKAFSYRQ